MYRNEKSHLLFPRLVFLKETKFKSWGEDEHRSTRVYILDWSKLDKKANTRGVRLFPESYIGWLNNVQFALPYNYRREIRRCVKMGILEWERDLGFDTSIRDMCLETAQQFIEVAFNLLADCPYDPETDYFYKGSNRGILRFAFIYRFWDGQTGWGMPWFKSGLYDYCNRYYPKKVEEDRRPNYYDDLGRFIEAVKVGKENYGKANPPIADDCEEVKDLPVEVVIDKEATDEILDTFAEHENDPIGGKVVVRKGVEVKPIEKPSPEYLRHMSQRHEDRGEEIPSRQCVVIEKPKSCPDVLSWCMDSLYLNMGDEARPFPANLKILLDTFQDSCPNCNFHLSLGKCLICRKPRHKLFPQPIYEVLGIRGQRTGNSFLSAVAATYQLHKALMVGNLAEYYDTEPSTLFEMVFVDPGKYIWDYFWKLVVASPWFQNCFDYLEDKYPDGPVGGFNQPNSDKAVFSHHGLIVRRGELIENYRGGTRIFATIDCPDWVQFLNQDDDEDDDGYTLDVEDTYTALSNSMVTAKSKAKQHSLALQPLLFCLGSPNPEVGFLKKKKEELEGNPRYLTYHQPTWKVNPEVTKEGLIKDIGDDWLFLRDFGAEY